ncbi:hypothetical protein GCM10011581_38610 [Saccharopolyspora subtropica]|uniref:Uncharacterized protein n=1 Tax=Saccharopolyspora thermophila TaxID=89367 RepID=A0A917K1X8_9PSEU|nr:hypothetical protein GCM10011581_38610 [Saccharopolyspora subtropica]
MDDGETARPQVRAGGGAVCAHIGIGTDDAQARRARDRLADALAAYRTALLEAASTSGSAWGAGPQ